MSRKKRPSAIRRVLKWGLKILFVLWLLTLVQVFLLRFINPPFTAGMVRTWVQNRGFTSNWRLRNSWRSLKEISPHLRKAVLAGEDQRFLSHHGFDLTEMNEAIKDMALRKRFRGASTITMQVARTVFLWPERSWLRKGADISMRLVCISPHLRPRHWQLFCPVPTGGLRQNRMPGCCRGRGGYWKT
ncbi:MAG: transglycosylase domain-containing protein [Deltaproteobacteria bacterium]|nr:transglycosylase domain-containing protein [Deltaproteobacteria bacterium]